MSCSYLAETPRTTAGDWGWQRHQEHLEQQIDEHVLSQDTQQRDDPVPHRCQRRRRTTALHQKSSNFVYGQHQSIPPVGILTMIISTALKTFWHGLRQKALEGSPSRRTDKLPSNVSKRLQHKTTEGLRSTNDLCEMTIPIMACERVG